MEKDVIVHDRAYTRRMNWRKALRKRRIIRNYGYDLYDNLHQYSKNKIHCSCPACRGYYYDAGNNSKLNKKISDRRKIDSMDEQLLKEKEENL